MNILYTYLGRLIVYVIAIALYFVFELSKNEIVKGLIYGIFVGDNLTWIFYGYMKLPEEWIDYTINLIFAVVVALLLFKYFEVGFPVQGEGLAMCFVMAIPVVILKVTFLHAKDISK